MKSKRTGAIVLPACLCLLLGMDAGAEDKPPERYIYSTYISHCDYAGVERADEVFETTQKPIVEAMVKDGKLSGYGWLAHHTGGNWTRAGYFVGGSVQGLLDALGAFEEELLKDKKAVARFSDICGPHEDYIWRVVAGNVGTTGRGEAAFSTYYVCDQSRETQADELVKTALAPLFDKMVADGKLWTWGWNEHIVGSEYRRLATFSAADVKTLMEARAALVDALDDNPANDLLTGICPSHADYIWAIKAQAP